MTRNPRSRATPASITVKVKQAGEYVSVAVRPVAILGLLAVHKVPDSKYYWITHIPTGTMLTNAMPDRESALAALRGLQYLDWESVVREGKKNSAHINSLLLPTRAVLQHWQMPAEERERLALDRWRRMVAVGFAARRQARQDVRTSMKKERERRALLMAEEEAWKMHACWKELGHLPRLVEMDNPRRVRSRRP